MATDDYYNSVVSMPLKFYFFLFVMFSFMGFSIYINYEPMFESLMDQIRLMLILSPLFLLAVVYWFSRSNYSGERGYNWIPSTSVIPFPEKDSLHRVGGSPCGLGVLLVVLMFMISYQSDLHERWFPLFSRG